MLVEVATTGSRLWRLKHRFAGKGKRLVLGAHPEVGLKVAREARDEARRLLGNGVDPLSWTPDPYDWTSPGPIDTSGL